MSYMCFDIGGTSVKYGVAEQNGKLLLKGGLPNEVHEKGVDSFMDSLVSVTELCRRRYNIQGIGVATAGVVDPDRGIVLDYSGFLPPDFGLGALLEQRCGLSCAVENDANAAALGEYWLGEGRGAEFFLLHYSRKRYRRCSCFTWQSDSGSSVWRRGSGASANWSKRRAFGTIGVYVGAGFQGGQKKGTTRRNLNGLKIFTMAQDGDPDAMDAVEKQMEFLATGIANICHILDPDRFIVGGGISAQADYLFPLLDAALRKRLLPLTYKNVSLRFAGLKNDAGMIGALYNFLQRHTTE